MNSNGLFANSQLTGTGKIAFRTQITAITGVTSGGPYVEIVRDLLKIILIRNHGVHLSLRGFGRDELYQLLEVALRSAVIIWKHANSALANQAANRRPVSKSSKASLGNCTNSGSVAEFTKYWARQR